MKKRPDKILAAAEAIFQTASPDAAAEFLLANAPLAECSQLYETLLAHQQRRKRHGSFYTPSALVRAAVRSTLKLINIPPEIRTYTVLDPAAGTGNFLVEAARELQLILPKSCQLEVIAIDQDMGALTIARRRLENGFTDLKIKTICGDALIEEHMISADLVVGNPPFVSLTGLSEDIRLILRAKFEFARGRFNLFTLFAEAAAKKWLKPGGTACLILPDRILKNVQQADFRHFITVRQTLLAVDEPPREVRNFPGATVDCIALIWQNRKPETPDYSFCSNGKKLPVKDFPEDVFTADCHLPEQYTYTTLGKIADIRDGIIQSKIGDELFVKSKCSPHCRKLLKGSQINVDQINWQGDYVDYQPERMQALERSRHGRGLRLRKPEIFERVKILTRQTADRIIAAFDCNGEYYYANTLHGITVTDNRFHPEFLLLWLNSEVLNKFYQHRSGENGRTFAQIKIAILKELPVPELTLAQQDELIERYRILTQTGSDKTVALSVIFDDFNG